MKAACTLGLIAILLVTHVPVSADTPQEDDISSWTWSENIKPGIFRWNVSEFTYLNEVVDTEEENELHQGSIIELHIAEKLNGLEFYQADENFTLPIDIYIDANAVDKHRLYPIEFVYPNQLGWQNGSYDNLFLLDQPRYRKILNFSNNSIIDGNNYIIEQDFERGKYYTVRDIDTGILMKWRMDIATSNLEYTYLGYERFNQIPKYILIGTVVIIGLVLIYRILKREGFLKFG